MSALAKFDVAGLPVGFWHNGLGEPPEDAVEITDEQHGDFLAHPGARRWDGSKVVAYAPPPPPRVVPDNPTLGDWRVGLLLWGRLDDVNAKISALCGAGEPMGFVAKERFDYSNNVLRKELLQLKDVLGFTEAEVDESLWRASMVAGGDLSGIWLG